MEFPAVHFGTVFSLGLIPSVGVQYVYNPLFKLILNGDNIADANFVPVSIGFAVLSAVSLYMPLYNHFALGKQSEVAPDDAHVITRESDDTDAGIIPNIPE